LLPFAATAVAVPATELRLNVVRYGAVADHDDKCQVTETVPTGLSPDVLPLRQDPLCQLARTGGRDD
jgi:hypothetical protein